MNSRVRKANSRVAVGMENSRAMIAIPWSGSYLGQCEPAIHDDRLPDYVSRSGGHEPDQAC